MRRLPKSILSILVLLLMGCAAIFSQTITFVPQAVSRIPGLLEYRVYLADDTGKQIQVRGIDVMTAAQGKQINPLSYVNLQAHVNGLNHRALAHWVSVGVEVAAWVMTAGEGADFIRNKERWKAVFPVLAGGLTLTRTMVEREHVPVAVPLDILPPLVAVPAGGAVDYSIFAK